MRKTIIYHQLNTILQNHNLCNLSDHHSFCFYTLGIPDPSLRKECEFTLNFLCFKKNQKDFALDHRKARIHQMEEKNIERKDLMLEED